MSLRTSIVHFTFVLRKDSNQPAHPIFSDPILKSALRIAKDLICLDAASEDSDQTVQVCRLILFTWRTYTIVGITVQGLKQTVI